MRPAPPRTPFAGVRLLRRLGAFISLAVASLMLAVQPAAAQPQGLGVSVGGGEQFPSRSLVLSMPPRAALAAAQVHVKENGGPVGTESVTPIRSANLGDFGVILAIDTSASMRGAAIANAMAAARALAAQRSAAQELSLILFAQKPHVALPLTADPQAINTALGQPPTVGGITRKHTAAVAKARHIYDGVQLALQQLMAAHIVSGAVIVLSNGADQGSQTQLQAIAAAANGAHIRIFTVGLRNASFHPETLQALAKVGGGSFTEANPKQLAQVFTAIEAGLTSKYIVHYRSLEAPGQIHINVTVDGVPGSASAVYAVANTTAPRLQRHQATQFWASSLALALAAIASALLVGLAIAFLVMPRQRSGSLRARVAGFVASSVNIVDDHLNAAATAAATRGPAERFLERQGWWQGFKEEVEIAGIQRTPIQIARFTLVGTLVGALLLYATTQSPVVILIALVAGPLAARGIVRHRLQRQRSLFAEQLPSHLQEVSSALRGGHSIVSGLTSVSASSVDPTRKEFQRVMADERLGMPLEEALQPLRERMASDEIEQLTLVAMLGRQTGGNMAEVVDRIADAVRERLELRRELQALTAQARLSRTIVSVLPVVVLVMITLINQDYMKPLYHTGTGQFLLVFTACWVFIGWFVMGRIVKIEV